MWFISQNSCRSKINSKLNRTIAEIFLPYFHLNDHCFTVLQTKKIKMFLSFVFWPPVGVLTALLRLQLPFFLPLARLLLLSQKSDAPIFFFCIIPWLGVFNKTNTVFHARSMSELFTPPVRYTALSCWIYLPRVTNYLRNKFLILNKKDWNICLIFRSFQVLNSISKK